MLPAKHRARVPGRRLCNLALGSYLSRLLHLPDPPSRLRQMPGQRRSRIRLLPSGITFTTVMRGARYAMCGISADRVFLDNEALNWRRVTGVWRRGSHA